MAETCNIFVEENNYKNVVLRLTYISGDGSGITAQKVYDATSSGAYGVTQGNQTFYPGIHTKLWGLDFDAQDLKVKLQWEATANSDLLILGSTPDDWRFNNIGGLRVPPGLTGATGSILLTTVGVTANSSFTLIMYLRKNVPQT